MKKLPQFLAATLLLTDASAATVTVGPWTPLFQGIELASGRQQATVSGERNHQVLCYRIDLTNPDVVLFTTPKCSNCGGYETLAENTSHFLEQYGVQVAVNGGFYASSSGPNDVPLGTPEDVVGLAISGGAVVSGPDFQRAASLLFYTNSQPVFLPVNYPGTNTESIYTAISGNLALLVDGANTQTPNPGDLDPRTAIGLSADRRYLFLMTIDGRQPGWSDGADFYNTGEWLRRFGASDGINVDGGGSTTMVMANCQGRSVRLNRSSFVAGYGRERNIGHNFGVYARPLPSDVKNLTVVPATTTTVLTWQTDDPATTQVEYGLTASYGSATPFESRRARMHVATLTGLVPGSNYFFRAISTTEGGQSFTQACQLATTTTQIRTQLFGLTKSWTYTTNNLDGINWKTIAYDDSGWLGSGPGLLYALENSSFVSPRNTAMPPFSSSSIPRTYYFRTRFEFTGGITGVSLILSNYVDDGAVFHLNGTEVYRLRMPVAPAPISYSTAASGTPCTGTTGAGDAQTTCPDVFTIGGQALTSLVQGENVLAVEVHNYVSGADLVFGMALLMDKPVTEIPRIDVLVEEGMATLYWNGEGFTLQQTSGLATPPDWHDVPGPVTRSPYTVPAADAKFYRLRL